MNFFLRLRHWQLFLLMIAVPFLFQIIFMGAMISAHNTSLMLVLFPIIMICFMGTYFGWLYTVGKAMHEKLPYELRGRLRRFQLTLLIPAIYMLCLSLFIGVIGQSGHVPGNNSAGAFVAIVIPLHLFSMVCIFYSLYFCAKALKAAEWQGPVTFSDFAGEFFLLWFFPIGVWIIQPRVNRLAAEEGPGNQLAEGQIFP